MSAKPTIYLAADPLGKELAQGVLAHLQQQHGGSYNVCDLGTDGKYYAIAHKAAALVQQSRAAGGADRAVLCCGTGMGMSIIANKRPHVYAAVVESEQAARDAAAINNANVLALGGKVFSAEEAAAAVDAWLSTGFTSGYDNFKEFLQTSMAEIPALLQQQAGSSTADAAPDAGAPYPTAALLVDGALPGSWQVLEPMGHAGCMWCKLREDAASSGSPGKRVRALVRFPAGALEPRHHHSSGHDQLIVAGDATVTNHTTGSTARLRPLSYLYTPAQHVHSVHYHADTLFYLGFDGALDLDWDEPGARGVTWESEAARAAAEQPWRPSDALAAAVCAAVEGGGGGA